jgi:dipeptidyl aminopeptidase/acylaminoacyl peptidase
VGLCRLDLADGRVRPLATDAADYGRPAWHPDGRSVGVSSDRGGRWQIWRFDADGGDAQPLPTALEPGRMVAWSADGRELVYESADRRRLRWRPADGGPERETEVGGDAELIDWRVGAGHLWWLQRAGRERIVRIDLATGRRETRADLPLGTFPERARLALAADGGLLVEIADTTTADLMQAR